MLKVSLFFGLILFVFLPTEVLGQNLSFRGKVIDIITGKPIPNVLVSIDQRRTFSNQNGIYNLIVRPGEYLVVFSASGYKEEKVSFKTYKDYELDITLFRVPDIASLRKTNQILQNDSMGVTTGRYVMDNKKIAHLPILFGEGDLLKNIQFLPGINKNKSGLVYTSIRGCNTNQTNFFVDGVPIYNIQHTSGYLSVFNETDFSQTEVIKSGAAANTGGRAGGSILFTPTDGDTKKLSGGYQLNLLVFSLNVNGPLGKKFTYNLSFRRSYIDWLLKPFNSDSTKTVYHFLDFNLRVKYAINKRNNVYFQMMNNVDILSFFRKETEDRGNGKTSEVKVNQVVNYGGYTAWAKWEQQKARGHNTLTLALNNINSLFSAYEENNMIVGSYVTNLTKKSLSTPKGLKSIGLIYDGQIIEPNGHLQYGGNFWVETYETGSQKLFQTTDTFTLYDTTYRFEPKIRQLTGALFGSLHKNWEKKHKSITIGLRLNLAAISSKLYIVPEPRISFYQLLDNNWHLKLAFERQGQMKNYLQTLYAGLMLTDQWLPLAKGFEPQVNDQLSMQIVKKISPKWSVEGNAYYIKMERVTIANPGAKQTNYLKSNADFDWHKQLVQGKGKSYGSEIVLHKNMGLSKGWISWCQTWSYRKIANYNDGNYFRYLLDRKSDFTLAMTHQWRRRVLLGTTLVLTGGFPISIPTSRFILPQGNQTYSNWQGQQVLVYGGKNNSTFGLFKRIDFNMNLIGKHPNGRKQQVFTITLYNLLSNFNPEVLRYNYNKQTNQYTLVAAQSFPLIPSIGYQYRF